MFLVSIKCTNTKGLLIIVLLSNSTLYLTLLSKIKYLSLVFARPCTGTKGTTKRF